MPFILFIYQKKFAYRIDQFDEDLESPKVQEELKAASELLVDLQTQMECVSGSEMPTAPIG